MVESVWVTGGWRSLICPTLAPSRCAAPCPVGSSSSTERSTTIANSARSWPAAITFGRRPTPKSSWRPTRGGDKRASNGSMACGPSRCTTLVRIRSSAHEIDSAKSPSTTWTIRDSSLSVRRFGSFCLCSVHAERHGRCCWTIWHSRSTSGDRTRSSRGFIGSSRGTTWSFEWRVVPRRSIATIGYLSVKHYASHPVPTLRQSFANS